MRYLFLLRPAHLLTAVLILAFGAGCADDPASRMESARQYQDNAEYRAAIIELKNVLQSDPANTEARAMLGEVTLLNGDSTTAIKELRKAQELGASPNLYAVPLARALLREGRSQEVSKTNPDLLTDNERKAALLALIGLAQLNLDNQPAAERRFSAALALVPGQADALIGNSRIARSRGDLDSAESSLEQMLQASPTDPDALAALAELQHSKGEFAAAEQSYTKALEAIEGTSRAHERMLYLSGLIDAMLAQEKGSQAQAVGARMMTISSEHPMALFQAARADYATGDYDAAIDKAARMVTIMPTAEPPRMLLVGAALAKGDRGLAATHLQVAVNNNPGNDKARKLLARLRLQEGDSTEALELLEPLMAGGVDDAQLLAMAGAANIQSGNEQAGMELMERGMEIGNNDPALMLQAAANFLASGEIDRAIEVLESLPEEDRVGQRDLLLMLALLRKGDEDAARARAQSVVNDSPESDKAHGLLGGFHLAIGEFDLARSEFQKALELNPGNVGAIVNLARIDIAEKKPEQAKARFQAMLNANPGNLLALSALAELAESGGDIVAGVALLEQAREANPDAIDPLLRLSRYYLGTGNLPLAEERADQAIRIQPSNGDGYLLLGQALIQDGRYSEALGRLEEGIKFAPKSARMHFHMGRALAATGRSDKSFDAYKRAAEFDPAFFPARTSLARAAVERGDLKMAISIANSLVTDYPDRAEPLILRGRIQAAQEDFPGALQSYQSAYDMAPSRELAANLFNAKKAMGEAEPWKELEQWLAAHPDDAPARTLLGAAYFESGMNDLARDSLKQVMATAPEARVAATLAEIERLGGNLDEASRWLRKAVELAPNELAPRQSLANIELQRGDTDSATKLLRQLRQDYPNAPELDLLEGEIYLATGNYSASITAFDRAFDAKPTEFIVLKRYQAGKQSGESGAWRRLQEWFADHPSHINAGLQLAQDYSERDKNKEAVETYEKVLAADPGNAFALNNIAWAYLKRGSDGDIKRGLAAASKAYDKMPQFAAIADTYGWLLLQDGQNNRAAEILGNAASGSDAGPEILYHHAVALDATGKDAEALAVLNRLLASNPSFDSRSDAEALKKRLSP